METQTFINGLILLVSFFGGMFMKRMEKSCEDLTVKVQAIELLVAGNYVTHSALKDSLAPIVEQLRRIESKLDNKADKHV